MPSLFVILNRRRRHNALVRSILSAHIGKIVAESKYAADVTTYTTLIKARNSTGIKTLLTNTTQEAAVLAQADAAAKVFSAAWVGSGASVATTFTSDLQNATAKLFRALIDITTEIEVQYVSTFCYMFDVQLAWSCWCPHV